MIVDLAHMTMLVRTRQCRIKARSRSSKASRSNRSMTTSKHQLHIELFQIRTTREVAIRLKLEWTLSITTRRSIRDMKTDLKPRAIARLRCSNDLTKRLIETF